MDKVMRVTMATKRTYCIYRYMKLSPCKTSPRSRQIYTLSDSYFYKDKTHELGLSSKCTGRRITFCFCKCCFHTNSVYCKRNKKVLNEIINKSSYGNSLENSNWNLHLDPGLNELVSDISKDYLHLDDGSHGNQSAADKDTLNSDLELKQILSELRKDFQNEEDEPHNTVKESFKDDMGSLPKSTEEIEDFTYEIEEEDDVQPEWKPPVELKRGSRGVFDIGDLVTVLETENAKDICVIQLPVHLQLADYMVIVSGISIRHCRAMTSTIQWIHKRKKKSRDPILKVEGIGSKDGWIAFDFGNIILHVMMPETRELYDLETLWTVGEKYDDRSLEIDNQLGIKQSDLEWLQDLDLENLYEKKDTSH